jgi:hypothetical protein
MWVPDPNNPNQLIPSWINGLWAFATDRFGLDTRPGAVFNADLVDYGVSPHFLQNLLSVQNGATVEGAGAGWAFTPASGIAPRDDVVPDHPMADYGDAGAPFYVQEPSGPTPLASDDQTYMIHRYTDNDSPRTGFPENVDLTQTQRIDLQLNFRLYSVVTYGDGSIYAVAHTDWHVLFSAALANGVPTVEVPNGVQAEGTFVRDNEDPWTAGPSGNEILRMPDYGWQPAP